MKYLSASVGLLTLLLPVAIARAEGIGNLQLYEKMHTITLQEVLLKDVDEKIVGYVVQLAEQEKMIPEGKSASDMAEVVKAAFETRLDDFCEMYQGSFDGCSQAYQMFRDWGRDILDTRTLSTDLLHIATGYETGVSGNMGEVFTIAERTLTIRNLWRSQDDVLLTPEVFPQVRAVPRPDGITDAMFNELGSALADHVPDAVWRYRYGLAAFGTEECSEPTDASELFEVTTQRVCTVEEKLRALRDALPSSALEFSPPLQRGEIVIFPLRKLDSPAHVIVWMMAENVDGTIKREAGVGWDLMLDPVPIGILTENSCNSGVLSEAYCKVADQFHIRPGGRYEDPPKEPEKNVGLCHLPFARDGYLCRPLRQDGCDEKIADKAPRSIVLTDCKPSQAKEPVSLTESGPDICRTGWWRIPGKELTESSSSSSSGASGCGMCSVDIQCESSCEEGLLSSTSRKDADGKIHICISSDTPRSGLLPMIVHELTHAQQLCNLAAGTDIFDTSEHCCAHEFEAYRTSCRILAEEGVLDELGVSLEECAGRSANASCMRFGDNACSALAAGDMGEKADVILKRKDSETSLLSCSDLTSGGISGMARLDSRILSMIEGLDGACSPGCQTKFENTIGNNLCYIGQCVEQSIEQERVIPGRMALTVEDESFPWDACAAQNPQAGGMITLPAISPPLTPSYNPRLLVESLDRALCQINGLPALSLPIRCQFDYQRRLSNTTNDYVSTALSFTSQIDENEESTALLQRMTQSIATRIGTSLLTRYLSWAGSALSDTLRTGNQLLNAMEKTKFPLDTCPRNATNQPDFCGVSDSSPE